MNKTEASFEPSLRLKRVVANLDAGEVQIFNRLLAGLILAGATNEQLARTLDDLYPEKTYL